MTENKRFNLAFYDNYDGTFSIQDTLYLKENKHLHSLDEIVDLLNELNEENQALKKFVEESDDLIKSLLPAYCNEKWDDFCKSYGVDLND